jgi:hypothetical protein
MHMSKPKEVDSETIRRVMGYVGSVKTEKKSKSSSVNLAKARENRWPKKEAGK